MNNQITQRTVLDNGLAILTGYVSEQATGFTHVAVRVNSGSADDVIDGQAHFLEHMLFNGIETTEGTIDFKTLKQQKEKYGIQFNAYTSQTETVYIAQIPVSLGSEGVERAVKELARMVISPALPEDRIAHEKKVIHNEWGSRFSDLKVLLHEETYINGFSSNAEFGHRAIGERDTILDIYRDDLINFMASHYTTGNSSISISGPVQHADIVSLVKDNFGDMLEGNRPDYPIETDLEPVYATTDLSIIPHSYFTISMPWPGRLDYDGSIAVRMAETIISKHLNDTVREENGTTYGLNVSSEKFRTNGFLSIQTDTDPRRVSEILTEIAAELNYLSAGDITRQLDVMKTIYKNGQNSVLTEAEYMCGNLAADQGNYGVIYDVGDNLAKIDAVKVEDIQPLIVEALSGQINFIGLGSEGCFLPQHEFDQIMRLQQASVKATLGQNFKLT